MPILLAAAALVVVGVLVAGAFVIITMARDPGDNVPQPHRAAAKGPRPAAGEPQWAPPAHHWVGLGTDWSVDDGFDSPLDQTALVSDGKRFVTFRMPFTASGSETAELTGYDGATGKRLWRKRMPWTRTADPVAGGGIVIVPRAETTSNGEKRVDYAALDIATGAQRWRVAGAYSEDPQPSTVPERRQPAGALLNGVFYYANGHTVVGADVATGKPRYRLTSRRYAGVFAPVVAGGRIAVLGSDGADQAVLVFPPDLEKYRPVRLPGAGSGVLDRMAASGDVLAAWTDGRFWTVDARTGRTLVKDAKTPEWHEINGVLGRTILVGGKYRYSTELSGYDLLTGKRTWSVDMSTDRHIPTRGFAIADGTVCGIGSSVSIIDPANGRLVFDRRIRGRSKYALRSDSSGLAAPAAGHLIIYTERGLTGYR